jgi:hypothetical protein
MSNGKGILENNGGAFAISGALVFRPLIRGWYNRWGATDKEVNRPLPGDEIVPNPRLVSTRAIIINACPEDIWPWLVQLGQQRGGLYSYELLENLARCDMDNADRILPEFQTLKIGDDVRLGPQGYPLFKVNAIQPNRAFILEAADPKTGQVTKLSDPMPENYSNGNWIFFLDEIGERRTRLITRQGIDYQPDNLFNRLLWRVITEPIGFIMTRKMLLGIKRRVESAAERQGAPVLL